MNDQNELDTVPSIEELSVPLSLFPGMQPDELYRKLVLTSPDGIAITDMQGTLMYASPMTYTMFGGNIGLLTGTRITDWITDSQKDKAILGYRKLFNGEDLPDNRYLLKRVDGTNFHGAINSSVLTDRDGRSVGVIATIRDITNQKKAEEDLLQNEIRYRLLFETAHDSIFLMTEHEFIDCNSKTLETFGCLKEEIIGKSPLDFSPPFQPDGLESSLKAKEKIQEALAGQSPRFEWKHQKLNGVLFDSEVSLNAITVGDRKYILAMVRNISKRKKSDDQLKKFSECLLSFGADPIENINMLTSLCGEILGASCSLYNRIQGHLICSLAEWNTPDDYITKSNAQGHICYDVIRNNEKEVVIIENLPDTVYFQIDPNVAKYKLRTYVGKVVCLSGKPVGSLCAVFQHDYIPDAADKYFISLIASAIGVEEERKESQDKTVSYTEELRELNNTKDKFFSIIAHDLKGPFNAIMGFSEILTTDWDDYSEEERLNFIQNINTSAKNTFRLLENLLEWAMTQTGKITFQPVRIDLSLIANDVVILLRQQAEKKQIKLYTAINFNTSVTADENMVRTVFRNLVSNAIKFTPDGGQIRIFSRDVPATNDKPPMVEVSVTDTGIGIEKHLLPKLFRIDEKTRTYGTAHEKGTGLGLILCRELIEKNHGKIEVESEPEKGSKFYFTLPAAL